jgi:hypothetical protein
MDENYIARIRFIKNTSIVSLAFFFTLFGWQLFVLISGNYPEHIMPMVKIFNGTEQALPVAYSWTIRLAALTIVGLLASLIACIVVGRYFRAIEPSKLKP